MHRAPLAPRVSVLLWRWVNILLPDPGLGGAFTQTARGPVVWPRAGSMLVSVELDRRRVLLKMTSLIPPKFWTVLPLCVPNVRMSLPWNLNCLRLEVERMFSIGLTHGLTLLVPITLLCTARNALRAIEKRRAA